jgi:hypothetical protein
LVLWTSDARSSVRRRITAALLLTCLAGSFVALAPRAQATGTPDINSWNPPAALNAGSNYTIRIQLAEAAPGNSWAQVNAGFSGSSSVVAIPQGATHVDVLFHANEEGGWGSATLNARVGITQNSGGLQNNLQTDSDQAQALWAD